MQSEAAKNLVEKRKNLWRLRLSFSSKENLVKQESPKTPDRKIPQDAGLKRVKLNDSDVLAGDDDHDSDIEIIDEWHEGSDEELGNPTDNKYIFSKSLDPVAKILLEADDIDFAASILKYDKGDKNKSRFKCALCANFKCKDRREQLHHIAQNHLEKIATVEQLSAGLKLIWQSKTDGQCVYTCKTGKCDFAIESAYDKKGHVIRSHISGHFKVNDELKLEELKKTWNIWRKDLEKLKVLKV